MSAPSPTTSGIQLNTSFLWIAFLLTFFKPQVAIDGGQPVKVGWGDAFLPVAPGAHRVNIWFNYIGKCGKAETVLTVPEGGAVPLRYKAPTWFVFSPGKLTIDGAAPAVAAGAGAPPAQLAQPVAQPVAQAVAQPVAQPVAQAVAAAAPAAEPQWDAQRNAWVQFDQAQQQWLQFDDASQQWRPIT